MWLFKFSNAILAKSEIFTLIFNRLLDVKHIAVQSRENNDEENSGGIEQQPFLGPNVDPNSKGIYWTNIQGISNKINTVFLTHIWSKTVKDYMIWNSFIVTNHVLKIIMICLHIYRKFLCG